MFCFKTSGIFGLNNEKVFIMLDCWFANMVFIFIQQFKHKQTNNSVVDHES